MHGQGTEQGELGGTEGLGADDGEGAGDALGSTLGEDAAEERGGQGLGVGSGILEHGLHDLELTSGDAADEGVLRGHQPGCALRETRGGEIDGQGPGLAHAQDELELDFGDGLRSGHLVPAGEDVSATLAGDEGFGHAQGRGTDARVGVGQTGLDQGPVSGPEAVLGPEGMDAAHGRGGLQAELRQRGREGLVAGLDDEALRSLASPFVAAGELADQVAGLQGRETGRDGGGTGLGHDAPDAAHAVRSDQAAGLALLAQVAGERDAVLDHAVMHVHDVEGALGAGEGVDGPEALVGGGEEFLLVIEGGAADEAGLVRLEHETLHEVARGLADEGVAVGVGREEVGAIHPGPACGGALLEAVVAEHLRAVAAVDARVHAHGPDGLLDGGLGVQAGGAAEVGIAEEVAGVDDVDAQEVAVVVGIKAPVVVLGESPLAAEVADVADPASFVVAEPRGHRADVKPAVMAPEERVRSALRIGELGP